MNKPTLESFLKNVARHQLTIEKDDGVFRHMRLGKPSSSDMHFHITTWPGYLCYSGDMGTFVFTRLRDMFEFFRAKKDGDIGINPHYWSEKVEASDRHGGVTEWSEKAAAEYVQNALAEYAKDRHEDNSEEGEEAQEELRDAIEALKDAAANEHEFAAAMSEWDNDCGIGFDDWYEHDFTTYTYRYLWCCYAIVWAIQQYDTRKEQQGEAA